MFNYLKRWECTIGELALSQTAQPFGDGEQLLVITTFRGPGGSYHAGNADLPFADAEKLADEAFRMKLARAAIEQQLDEMRKTVSMAEKALGLPRLVEASAS
jgi:hypothetical protein